MAIYSNFRKVFFVETSIFAEFNKLPIRNKIIIVYSTTKLNLFVPVTVIDDP